MEVNPTEINPYTIVSQNINVLKQHADNKTIRIENNIPQNITCKAYENMISTIFRNLISNSVKFTNKGGLIKVFLQEGNEKHTFCVSDNGIGMDEQTDAKIFNTAKKVQRSGTNDEVGTGLGLILCKEFIEKNGEKIWVESQPNIGTTFCFTLPKAG